MKLYTEEQVKVMIDDAHNGVDGYYDIFKKHTPVVLPTEEEVENYYGKVHDFGDWEGFKRGTKWMRDKIQGGNQ